MHTKITIQYRGTEANFCSTYSHLPEKSELENKNVSDTIRDHRWTEFCPHNKSFQKCLERFLIVNLIENSLFKKIKHQPTNF